jgi:hypothetical protein
MTGGSPGGQKRLLRNDPPRLACLVLPRAVRGPRAIGTLRGDADRWNARIWPMGERVVRKPASAAALPQGR